MIKKNIFSVFLAVFLSVSILCVNVSAFSFDGENRSLTDIYSDWFVSTREFCYGNTSFEEWRNSNERLYVDITGSCLFPGSDTELREYLSDIENQLRTAVEGTDNTVDDTFIDVFGKALGYVDFRPQFEQWYQDKYGKEYGKHEIDSNSGIDSSGCNYYIYFKHGGTEYRFYVNASIHDSVPVQFKDGKWVLRFRDIPNVISFKRYTKSRDTWYTQDDPINFNAYYVDPAGFYGIEVGINSAYGLHILTSTNLPLDFSGGSGDVPSVDIDPDFSGDLVAPTITLPEIGDLLTDLDNDLKNADTGTDNPNKGVEIKITQLTNKLHNDFSKVIEYLKKILEKITDFFDNFFDRLGDFFQSVFVPQDDYFNNAFMDISAEFDDVFSFAGDLRLIFDNCITAYKNGGTRAPEIEVSIDGYGSPRKLDFSIFDKSISLVRSVLCAICYASFALSTYRRIPLYISGGGER